MWPVASLTIQRGVVNVDFVIHYTLHTVCEYDIVFCFSLQVYVYACKEQ